MDLPGTFRGVQPGDFADVQMVCFGRPVSPGHLVVFTADRGPCLAYVQEGVCGRPHRGEQQPPPDPSVV